MCSDDNTYCVNLVTGCGNVACLNGANCTNSVCVCPTGYTGADCGTLSPQNCVVSAWGTPSQCSVSCGGGAQTLTRTVLVPQANNGAPCPNLTMTQSCNNQSCPGMATNGVLLCLSVFLSLCAIKRLSRVDCKCSSVSRIGSASCMRVFVHWMLQFVPSLTLHKNKNNTHPQTVCVVPTAAALGPYVNTNCTPNATVPEGTQCVMQCTGGSSPVGTPASVTFNCTAANNGSWSASLNAIQCQLCMLLFSLLLLQLACEVESTYIRPCSAPHTHSFTRFLAFLPFLVALPCPVSQHTHSFTLSLTPFLRNSHGLRECLGRGRFHVHQPRTGPQPTDGVQPRFP